MFFNRPKLPSQEFLGWANNVAKNTPDIALLQQYEHQLLFVGDEMLKHHRGHKLLSDRGAQFKGNAFTKDTFTLHTKEFIAHQVAVPLLAPPAPPQALWLPPRPGTPAPIKGELYSIRPNVFLDLDKYKDNGVVFQRKRVRLEMPHRHLYHKPWFNETTKHGMGALSRAERELKNPEEFAGPFLGPEVIKDMKAWMYIGKPEYWKDVLNPPVIPEDPSTHFNFSQAAEPVKLFKTDGRPLYYHFIK